LAAGERDDSKSIELPDPADTLVASAPAASSESSVSGARDADAPPPDGSPAEIGPAG
jgi:hypothetical protein